MPPLGSLPVHLGRYLHFDWTTFRGNLDGFREWGWSKRLLEWLVVAGLIGLARRSLAGAVLIGGWFVTYLLLKGGDPIFTMAAGNFLTHMVAVLPAFVLLGASVVFCIPVYGRRHLGQGAASWPRSVRSQRRVLALLSFLAVVPIGVFLILPPSSGPTTANLSVYDVLIPANRFSLSAHATAGSVALAWPSQPTNGTAAVYIVFRSPAATPALNCQPTPARRRSLRLPGDNARSRSRDLPFLPRPPRGGALELLGGAIGHSERARRGRRADSAQRECHGRRSPVNDQGS